MSQSETKVLYIIGKRSETSFSFELSQFISDQRVNLVLAVYYGGHSTPFSEKEVDIVEIESKSKTDPKGPYNVYKYIKSERPDIVHVHHTVSGFWGALIGKWFDAKIIRTVHRNHKYNNTLQNIVNVMSFIFTDLIICNSKNTRRGLHSWERKLVESCQVIYNGIDIERVDEALMSPNGLQEEVQVSDGEVVVGSVGRLIRHKNYETLLDSWKLVIEEVPTARLVIVGDGPLRETLEQRVQHLGIGESISFLGAKSRDRTYEFLHLIDIYVMPSRSEGFCNALVEAMAAGKPIVSSDIPVFREVMGSGARYVDPENPNSIAAGIVETVSKGPEQWDDLGRAAREKALQHYSIKRTSKEYTEKYVSLGRSESA